MEVLAIFNVKGGVGKSTTAITIAHMMSSVYRQRVLFIDLDPQGNSTDLFLGDEERQPSVENLLEDVNLDIRKCILPTAYDNLHIIPAYLTLAEIDTKLKEDKTEQQQFRLKKHLKQIEEDYDYCILDCSPSVSLVNLNGLIVANKVYIPTKCDRWSIRGIQYAMNLVETAKQFNPILDIAGCFFTHWRGRRNVDKGAYQLIEDMFGDKLIPITIGVSKFFEETTYEQKPLLAYDSGKNKNKVTEQYIELTEYMLGIH